MAESENNISYQKYFNNADYADILVTLGFTAPKISFPMHQIIVYTTSEYFKQLCDEKETSETGTKLLSFDMSLEAFQIIAAWVYGYGEESFKSQIDTQVIREALSGLGASDMTQSQEMEDLRVGLVKHLFRLELNIVASGNGGSRTKLEVLEDICEFSVHYDRNMLKNLVKQNIPGLRASEQWLNDLHLKPSAAAVLAASVLIDIHQQGLDQRFCIGCTLAMNV
ncbi:hypothetical protein AOL_s00110g195 [Orbilia oligospora ATCC 24927]|uniref:BTB domain-containing protein n=1 Tax=Arthrobotrys oligospora (strain ATCC 24927 / CBS 115.81 / DSM 1491) TaxID=756982 RepID=G1XL25_ARTOA|nr:hypothetical protein AOL_s00110g195 [Orbilia oligospora ATCC 24927]EGX46031.1 hypothetical protein AOL_s00110g195 [Orbilia oligospora ATCC 24927]